MNNDRKGSFKSPNFNHKDKQLSERLQGVLNKNRSLPNIGTSFNNEEKQEEENKSGLQQAKEKIQEKATAKIIEKATGGLVQGQLAEEAAKLARKGMEKRFKKYKIYLIAGLSSFAIVLIIIMGIIAGKEDNSSSKANVNYVTGAISEEELINQLIFYGYCNSRENCKSKGIYKFYVKLKQEYDKYENYNSKYATTTNSKYNYKNYKTPINTALIIETINYYQEKGLVNDYYLEEETETKKKSFFEKISEL